MVMKQMKASKSRDQVESISFQNVAVDYDLCDSDLEVLEVFYVSSVVAISLTPLKHPESAAAHCVHIGPSIRQQLQSEDLQHAAIVCKPAANTVQP